MADTVTVACKLPHGLVLRVFKKVTRVTPMLGGGMREYEINEPMGDAVTLHGYATPHGVSPGTLIAFGHGFTPDVDADFWKLWVDQNKDTEIVRKKLVFAFSREDQARSAARERENVRNGLEPIDPENMPREFRPHRDPNTGTMVGGVVKATPGPA